MSIPVSSSLSALFFVFRVLLVFVVFCYSLLIIILLKERLVECQLLICLTRDISQTKKVENSFHSLSVCVDVMSCHISKKFVKYFLVHVNVIEAE